MSIDPRKIASDVTLELDEEAIAAPDFQKAVEHFLGLVHEIAKATAPNKGVYPWTVSVYPGSVGVGLNAPRQYTPSEIENLRDTLATGLSALEANSKPPQFTDRALEHSRILSSLRNPDSSPISVKIWSGNRHSTKLSPAVATTVLSVLAPSYEEESSAEGVLEKIDAHKRSQFVIYDTVTGRAIECQISVPLLGEALRAFRKRVEVVGKVHYRADGQPVRISAREIIPFPDSKDVPTVEQVRELLKGA